jgi:hypothetical protein
MDGTVAKWEIQMISKSLIIMAAICTVPVAASAKSWEIACTQGVCAAVNDEGRIAYLDQTQQHVIGRDTLPDT